MSITNKDFISKFITNNQEYKVDTEGKEYIEYTPVKYRWTHGASDFDMGDGLLIYSTIQYIRAKTCVCLGSGGGFIPRIMTQARIDLHDQNIFEGDKHNNWGDIGVTIIVDADNKIGGETDWTEYSSFLRSHFYPRYIKETTENAYYNFFVKEDIKIDYLHIDAGHSYENIKQDFELYSKLLNKNGIISVHDTDKNYSKNHIISEDSKHNYQDFTEGPSKFISEIGNEWQKFNFFNEGIVKDKPSSTGITFIKHA
jgi:hypothetical protein